jgi:protein-tyrosine phosphatase
MWSRLFGRQNFGQPIGHLLGADMHAHLLPGVDDGPQSIHEALDMLRKLAAFGYSVAVATPHTFHPLWPDNQKAIDEASKTIQDIIRDAGLPLEFRVGAEYFCGEAFGQAIDSGDLLTLDGTRVLFETPPERPYPAMHQFIFDMRRLGFIPVLAHPERYLWLQQNLAMVSQLRDWGCEFQITLGSASGRYGPKAAQLARYLIQKGLVDFAGTDLHRARQIPQLHRWLSDRWSKKLLQNPLKNNLL